MELSDASECEVYNYASRTISKAAKDTWWFVAFTEYLKNEFLCKNIQNYFVKF